MKDKITLFDKATGKALTLGTEDGFNDNLVLMLPSKNGTLALVEDVEQIQTFLQGGQLVASDSEKLGGKLANQYAYADMSNMNVDALPQVTLNSLRGYTGSKGIDGINGYNGSKGDIGQGFKITAIFDSLTELLVGTTDEESFALVAGTLPQSDPDYGKLYLRKNNTWTYITDLSIEGAAGVQGPQGDTGYTGSQGIQGIQGYTGSIGVGYTGSKGDNGTISAAAPSGGIEGDTWYQY